VVGSRPPLPLLPPPTTTMVVAVTGAAAAAGAEAVVPAVGTAVAAPKVVSVAADNSAAVGPSAVGSTGQWPTAAAAVAGVDKYHFRSTGPRQVGSMRRNTVVWTRFAYHQLMVSCRPRRTFDTSTSPSAAIVPAKTGILLLFKQI